jgi:PhnB protein
MTERELDRPDEDLIAVLHDLPRERFRTELQADLERMSAMTTPTRYIPEGLGNVTPYVFVRDSAAAIKFYKRVFDAIEVYVHPGPDGRIMHAKLRIGDSMMELGEHSETSETGPDQLPPVAMHLYVADVDDVVAKARSAGADCQPPENQFYGDREASVKDPFGIQWFVATHVADT